MAGRMVRLLHGAAPCTFEARRSVSGKSLRCDRRVELLKQIAPSVKRAAVLRDITIGSGASQFAVIQAVAPSLGVEVNPVNVGGASEIERAVATFARSPNGGLIATGSSPVRQLRDLIIKLAALYKLPAVYYERVFVDGGGLISYGPDFLDQFRNAAPLRPYGSAHFGPGLAMDTNCPD